MCGYLVWAMVSQSHVITVAHVAPVCVYNASEQCKMNVPETVTIMLQGQRSLLYSLDTNEIAVHVDASRLHAGDNHLVVDRATLFLPDGINVVHYSPSNAVINITEKI